MFTSPDPKSPLFDMVRGIVNAQAELVRAKPVEPRSSGPTIPVTLTVDGKTFTEQMTVDMSGLAAAIVERALKFTDANDRGDEASRLLEQFDDDDAGPEAVGCMQASEAADEDYNTEKARLFELCRLLAAARAAEQSAAGAAK